MARPRKGEEKHATAAIGVRISDELRQGIEALAAKHERSLTDEIRHALESYVSRELRKAGRSVT